MKTRARWITGLVGSGIVAAVMLPPFVGDGVRHVLMDGFAAVCHQLPDRSAAIGGVPLAVCHRCLGIYAGIPAAALVFPVLAAAIDRFKGLERWVLLASLVPLSVDWLIDATGWGHTVPWSRALTGWIFGAVAGYFLVQAVSDLRRPVPAADGSAADASPEAVS